MTLIPLAKKLKKELHRKIALAQDVLIVEIYRHFPKAVIHGGTAIWRCYGNNRFSEDIDVYIPKRSAEKLAGFRSALQKAGFGIQKFKKTSNAVFAELTYSGTIIKFEALFKTIPHYQIMKFETADGTHIMVNTLSPENLLREKISAYMQRKKVRDLYDIFFLLDFLENKKAIRDDLKKFLNNFVSPCDEKELKALIITGAIPRVEDMMRKIKKWVK